MIKKNYKDVGFVYKGTQVIDKVYKGTDLVFEQGFVREDSGNVPLSTTHQAIGKDLKDYRIYGNSVQGKLPDTYQQVEYIESTGTQYINTEISSNINIETEIDVQFTQASTASQILMWINTSSGQWSGQVNEKYGLGGGIEFDINSTTRKLVKISFSANNSTQTVNMEIDGNVISRNGTVPSATNYKIFKLDTFGSYARIYSVIIKENDVILRKYTPCYRKSDNEIGLYDLVSNTFFTNSGRGTFNKGADTPTPSNPIEIESVGDKTKNLFNYKTASTQKGSFDNNGVFHATDNDNRDNLIYKIQLYNNNTMVTNSSRNISITGTGTYRVTSPELIQSGTTKIRFANNGSSSEFSINCDIDGSQFVGQYASIVFTVDDVTVGASVISDIMFYVGNEPFDYEPYGYKIPVKVKSKNLFDDTTLSNKWINVSGSVVDLQKTNCKRFECVEGETYTLSASYETQHANNIIVMAFYDSNDTLISRNVVSNLQYEELIVTAPQNSKYLYAGHYTMEPQTIQLEKSDIATEYEPYVEPVITNIYLDEPLRKIGDYSDYVDFKNSKVVRNIAKKVLNGTEDWGLPGTIISDYSSYRIVNFIPNLPLQTPIEELLCTHFEALPKSQYQQEPIQNKITSYGNTNQIIILVSNNIADSNNQTTTANWINWLSNNNITLYYSKQPTEETILLPNIPTIKGTTIFEIDTEIQPSSMYINYKGK